MKNSSSKKQICPSCGSEVIHLQDSEAYVGLHVLVRIGQVWDNKFVAAVITDLFTSGVTGERLYELQRTEGGKKLGLKGAEDLFPLPATSRPARE